jgi:hypothetical protein
LKHKLCRTTGTGGSGVEMDTVAVNGCGPLADQNGPAV